MNKKLKRVILSILGFLLATLLLVFLNFYIQLAGNPFTRWQEQRTLVQLYEDRYGEPFEVQDSDYDYKRHEFSFQLIVNSDPNHPFKTTVEEARRFDALGEARSIALLYKKVSDALGSDYADLNYHINIFEAYDSPGVLETDPLKRMNMNAYTVDFSWDVEKVVPEEIDAVFQEIGARIGASLQGMVGEVEIRASVYDGTTYHFAQWP